MAGRKPYPILIGDAGVEKSMLLEKVTRVTGKSSPASTSAAKSSKVFEFK